MELEFWSELSAAVSAVEQRWERHARDVHPTSRIVRVHLWSVLHDRPTLWACDPGNWTRQTLPPLLPDQSTMSRRMRRADFDQFLTLVGQSLAGPARDSFHHLVKIIDGKSLELPNHTTDRDAGWGRGVSRTSVGYKLHMIFSPGNPMPEAFVITSLNVCEKQMAFRMIQRVQGTGYLLGDPHFNASWLFDVVRLNGHQLVCPRSKPGTGIGHHYQSTDRLRAIDMLEPPAKVNRFGLSLYGQRTEVERSFSQMVCYGAGLGSLPTWVRRIWRVRRWVWAKILFNAARIRINRRKRVNA